jgi:hypothetical protein
MLERHDEPHVSTTWITLPDIVPDIEPQGVEEHGVVSEVISETEPETDSAEECGLPRPVLRAVHRADSPEIISETEPESD